MPNYATKCDLKRNRCWLSNFALRADLARLKSEIDKLDVDESKITPVILSRQSDIVKNKVVKKIVYDELVKKGNAIDTSGPVKKQMMWLRLKVKYLELLA